MSTNSQSESPQAYYERTGRRKPGPKHPHAGQFQKGFDPRRQVNHGHKPRSKEIEALLKTSAPVAINYLLGLLSEESDAPHAVRYKAAEYIVSQAIGSPVTRNLLAASLPASGGAMSELLAILDKDPPGVLELESRDSYQDPPHNFELPKTLGIESCTDVEE